jgi:hypothetical protein
MRGNVTPRLHTFDPFTNNLSVQHHHSTNRYIVGGERSPSQIDALAHIVLVLW